MFDPVRGIEGLEEGIYLSRPNRFTIRCLINNKEEKAYLPNPGRLLELLLKDRRLYLIKNNKGDRKKYTVLAVDRDGIPVLLHTHYMNDVAAYLLENNLVKGLEGYRIIKREFMYSRSRFDFLLERDGRLLVLEVKSCTLFGNDIAMFPDAITERGKRHILEMAEMNYDACVLFIVNTPNVRYFLPDYHTDLFFSKTLFDVREKIMIKAIGLGWKMDLSLSGKVKELGIPWEFIVDELDDRGSYILILSLKEDQEIEVGKRMLIPFKSGYYLYVGSEMKGLTSRINRHRRIRKKPFWHIDYLREKADFVNVLPIRTKKDIECLIAKDIRKISDWVVSGFGSSDCNCESHLFALKVNPLEHKDFIDLLIKYRINRIGNQNQNV